MQEFMTCSDVAFRPFVASIPLVGTKEERKHLKPATSSCNSAHCDGFNIFLQQLIHDAINANLIFLCPGLYLCTRVKTCSWASWFVLQGLSKTWYEGHLMITWKSFSGPLQHLCAFFSHSQVLKTHSSKHTVKASSAPRAPICTHMQLGIPWRT